MACLNAGPSLTAKHFCYQMHLGEGCHLSSFGTSGTETGLCYLNMCHSGMVTWKSPHYLPVPHASPVPADRTGTVGGVPATAEFLLQALVLFGGLTKPVSPRAQSALCLEPSLALALLFISAGQFNQMLRLLGLTAKPVSKSPPLNEEQLVCSTPLAQELLEINVYAANIFLPFFFQEREDPAGDALLCVALCWRFFHRHMAMKTMRISTMTPSTQPTTR